MLEKIEIKELTQEALDKQTAGVTVGLVAGFITLVALNVMNQLTQVSSDPVDIEVTDLTTE